MTRMSRTIGLVLLGGAALSTCCCLLRPPQPPPPPPQQYDENGNPIPPAQQTATTSSGHSGYYRRSHSSFWTPFLWTSTSRSPTFTPYRSPGGRPSGASPVAPGGPVSRGGFGGTGRGVGGAAS
jgi:hypothetical protein